MQDLAIVFPGIGYHTDRPLLYFARRLARAYGYEVRDVRYTGLPEGVKDSPERMAAALTAAGEQAARALADVPTAPSGRLLLIGKSIGTAVAAACAEGRPSARLLLYTPILQTFRHPLGNSLLFHGSADPWLEDGDCARLCRERGAPLVTIPGANHSLETGDVRTDIENLALVMRRTEEFLAG